MKGKTKGIKRPKSEEWKNRMKIIMKGKNTYPRTEEWKRNHSITMIGHPNFHLGKSKVA